jgi:hypothetical protein
MTDKNVGLRTRIVKENKLLRSKSGLFTKSIVISDRVGDVELGTLLSKLDTGMYVKFMEQSDLSADAATAQADIAVSDASKLKAGDTIQVEDDNANEELVIDSISDNVITATSPLSNSYTTAANARVYLKGGAEDSENAVINLLDTVVAGDTESSVVVTGVVNEVYVKGNLSDLDKSKVQRITFV